MKTQFIGVLCLIAAFSLMWQSQPAKPHLQQGEVAPEAVVSGLAEATEAQAVLPATSPIKKVAEPAVVSGLAHEAAVVPAVIETVRAPEETFTLENDFIRVTFTNYGGAIKQVEFIGTDPGGKLLYPTVVKGEEPYVFNRFGVVPALALSWDASGSGEIEEFAPAYDLQAKKGNVIQFHLRTEEGIDIIRGYKVRSEEEVRAGKDPYVIEHETRFVNTTVGALALNELFISAGTLPPTEGDIYSQYLNVGYFNAREGEADFIHSTAFRDSKGFLGFGASVAKPYVRESAEISWGAIKNQFFTGVITPREHAQAVYARPYDLPMLPGNKAVRQAVTGYVGFQLGALGAEQERVLGLDYYVGPKEFTRLEDLGGHQDELMEFGWVAFMSQLLLSGLTFIHRVLVHLSPEWAWGWAIILLTCMVKGAMWPLTAMQVRSSKKMQAIQEPMKAVREKHKDNPQKLQAEMMKLYKEHQVNPAAGCLPLLIQIPIFFGLYYMLRTASELRFAAFLWVDDLSVADTVSWLPSLPEGLPFFGGPIHVLPLLMGVSMFFQMRMMPPPTTDNVQVKMLKFMPFIFLFFAYRFPSGLVLYWTMQNLLTIVQTKLTRDLKAVPATAAVAPRKRGKKR